MALASHHAADGEKGRSAEAEFVSAEESREDYVAARFESAVNAQTDAAAKAGAQKRVVSIAQTDFPRKAKILCGGERRCAGAPGESTNRSDVRAGFRDTRGDDSDTRSGNEFDADARTRVDSAQIVNQMREVVEAIDVVMRRRRNQRHSRRSMAESRDIRRNLCCRNLAAFARFCALPLF